MNHLIKARSLASTFSHSRFPRTLACLGGALFLMIASVLWQPGKPAQANERLTMIPPSSIAQSLSTPTHTATPTPLPSSTPSPGTICGRLRPHSLDDILAAIPILPTVRNVIIPSKGENPATDGPAKLWSVIQEDSRFDDSCNDRLTAQQTGNPTFKVGDQKKATIEFLTWFLDIWERSKEVMKKGSCDGKTKFNESVITLCKNDNDAISGKYGNFTPDMIRRQIKLLNTYNGSLTVYLKYKHKDGDKELTGELTAQTDKDGNFVKKDIQANATYEISTNGDLRHTEKEYRLEAGEKVKITLEIEDRPVSLLSRAVVGYQQAGAAATSNEQNYFFDLFVSQTLPFRQKVDPDVGEKWRSWGVIRAISVPQPGDVPIGDFIGSGTNSFVAKVSELRLKDAARVFDYLGGVEFQFWRGARNYNLLPSFDGNTKQKFSLALIASGGFVTPTNPLETQPKVYELTEQIKTEFNRTDQNGKLINPQLAEAIKGKQYIAFLSNDRDRFFRQYYAGFRAQTFYFNRYNVPIQRFPAQFDFTIGQNEYVTGGRLRGVVMRLDAYYPLPYDKMNFISIFGMAVFRPTQARETTPLLLKEALIQNPPGSNPATGPVLPTDSSVGLIPVGQFNRDYYRVGVGIDLPFLLHKILDRP